MFGQTALRNPTSRVAELMRNLRDLETRIRHLSLATQPGRRLMLPTRLVLRWRTSPIVFETVQGTRQEGDANRPPRKCCRSRIVRVLEERS